MNQIETAAGPVRRGSMLRFESFLEELAYGSVLSICGPDDPGSRNGQTTLLLECGDAGRWCYTHQVREILDF